MSDKTYSRLVISTTKLTYLLDHRQILYCRSENRYCVVYTITGDKHLVSKSLSQLMEELNPGLFIRVSQSNVINREFVSCIDKEKRELRLSKDEVNATVPYTINLAELMHLLTRTE